MIRALLLSILLVLPFAAVSQAREDGGVITAPSGTIPVGDNAASDAAIRTRIDAHLGTPFARALRIQYGGSVNASNAAELMSMEDIDGALVGGAALEAASFARIVSFQDA